MSAAMTSTTFAAKPPEILPPNIPIEEERKDDYNPQHYFPVKIGHFFHNNYRIITKLGYGGGSTVWLAEDINLYASFLRP
jgi:serine/threonine-protein kinase SRPK3